MERKLLFKWQGKAEGDGVSYYISFTSGERREPVAKVNTERLADKLCQELDSEMRFKLNLRQDNVMRCQMQAAMRCLTEVHKQMQSITAGGMPGEAMLIKVLEKELAYYQSIIEGYFKLTAWEDNKAGYVIA